MTCQLIPSGPPRYWPQSQLVTVPHNWPKNRLREAQSPHTPLPRPSPAPKVAEPISDPRRPADAAQGRLAGPLPFAPCGQRASAFSHAHARLSFSRGFLRPSAGRILAACPHRTPRVLLALGFSCWVSPAAALLPSSAGTCMHPSSQPPSSSPAPSDKSPSARLPLPASIVCALRRGGGGRRKEGGCAPAAPRPALPDPKPGR